VRIPDWYALLLLGLAAYRVWRILGLDDVLDKPRRWLVRLPDYWQPDGGGDLPDEYREHLAKFIQCPWCLGFWVALGWWGAWQVEGRWTLIVAAPFAIATVVGELGKFD
jgi:hypothetical protein